MKASELIARLEQCIEDYGDLNVIVADFEIMYAVKTIGIDGSDAIQIC